MKFFKGNNFAFLGTLNKDGSPQVTPTWIDIVEDEGQELILINTARDRIKQKNVSRDPRVSISAVDEENPYSMITIKGRVVDQTTNGADEHIDKLAKRYLNAERYPAHSSNVKRIILKIKPEKIFYLPPRYTEYLKKINPLLEGKCSVHLTYNFTLKYIFLMASSISYFSIKTFRLT